MARTAYQTRQGQQVLEFLQAHPTQQLTAEEIGEIVRFACCAASLSTQQQGGISSVQEEADVRSLMAKMA